MSPNPPSLHLQHRWKCWRWPPKSTKPVGIQSITRPAPRNIAGAHEDLRDYGHWQPWTHHPKVPNDPSQYDEAKVVGFTEEVVQASLASAQIIWIIVCVEENRDHLHWNRGHDVASCLGHTGKTCLSASPKNSLTPLFYLRYRSTILVANHHFFATPLMDHLINQGFFRWHSHCCPAASVQLWTCLK